MLLWPLNGARKTYILWLELCIISILLHGLFIVGLPCLPWLLQRSNLPLWQEHKEPAVILTTNLSAIVPIEIAQGAGMPANIDTNHEMSVSENVESTSLSSVVHPVKAPAKPKKKPTTLPSKTEKHKKMRAQLPKAQPSINVQKKSSAGMQKKDVASQNVQKISKKKANDSITAAYPAYCKHLAQAWSCPPGMRVGCCSTYKAYIGVGGVVQNLECIQPSGVLLFDIAARKTIAAIKFPRHIWGTTQTFCMKDTA